MGKANTWSVVSLADQTNLSKFIVEGVYLDEEKQILDLDQSLVFCIGPFSYYDKKQFIKKFDVDPNTVATFYDIFEQRTVLENLPEEDRKKIIDTRPDLKPLWENVELIQDDKGILVDMVLKSSNPTIKDKRLGGDPRELFYNLLLFILCSRGVVTELDEDGDVLHYRPIDIEEIEKLLPQDIFHHYVINEETNLPEPVTLSILIAAGLYLRPEPVEDNTEGEGEETSSTTEAKEEPRRSKKSRRT